MSDLSPRLPAWVPPGAGKAFACREMPGVAAPSPAPAVPTVVVARPAPAELAERLVAGDRSALARAITLVESNAPRHRSDAREVIEMVSNRAGQSRRIGISGVPGAGKSTFIEVFGNYLCDRGRRLAVLAVDPSSSLSGGSILGDKTRMELLSRRQECFIRPSPAGGALGGVTRKTRETILLCEAAGYDTILVETVGVGQSEITVRSMVDCFLLLMIAGAGDELQGIKKGIIEIADLIAVNKADGNNRNRVRAARAELERVTSFLNPFTTDWRPPVLAVSALEREGLKETWAEINRFFTHIAESGEQTERRKHQALEWWRGLVEQELRTRFFSDPRIASEAARLEAEILAGLKPPSIAAEEVLDLIIPNPA